MLLWGLGGRGLVGVMTWNVPEAVVKKASRVLAALEGLATTLSEGRSLEARGQRKRGVGLRCSRGGGWKTAKDSQGARQARSRPCE